MQYVMNTEIKRCLQCALLRVFAEEGHGFLCNRSGVQSIFLECVLHIRELKKPSCICSMLQHNLASA